MGKLLLCVLLVLWNCHSTSKKDIKIQGVKVSQVYPILDNAGKVHGYDTTDVKIFFGNDFNLYESEYDFDSVVNHKLILFEERHHILIHPSGSAFGYDYDLNKFPSIRKVLMDSVRRVEWFHNIKIYPILFMQSTATLISSEKNNTTGVRTEKYYLKGKTEMDITGNCVLKYTDTFSSTGFTLSRELDSIKRMKLIQVNIESLPRVITPAEISIERMELSYFLESISKSHSDVEALYKKVIIGNEL